MFRTDQESKYANENIRTSVSPQLTVLRPLESPSAKFSPRAIIAERRVQKNASSMDPWAPWPGAFTQFYPGNCELHLVLSVCETLGGQG